MSEELQPHPGPKVEEYVHGHGDWQEQAVETQAAGAGAVLGEAFLHRGGVEQACQGHQRDEDSQGGQRRDHPPPFLKGKQYHENSVAFKVLLLCWPAPVLSSRCPDSSFIQA